jgi:hypothetical protein
VLELAVKRQVLDFCNVNVGTEARLPHLPRFLVGKNPVACPDSGYGFHAYMGQK